MGSDSIVARSLKIARTTFSMVAAFTAAVAANAMVALQMLSATGQAAVLMLLFVFISIITAAVAMDIFSRSSQTVATLRTLGAKRGTVTVSMSGSLIIFGSAGAALGAVLGAAIGAMLVTFGTEAVQGALAAGIVGILVDGLLVLGLSAAAIGIGTYTGVRAAWRS